MAVIGTAAAATRTGAAGSLGRFGYPISGAIYPDRDEPWGDPFKRRIIGRLRRATQQEVELESNRGSRLIPLASDVSIYTDREAQLGDFFPRELLVVEGGSDNRGEFEATAVWSAVTTVVTRVEASNGEVVETETGRIVLTPRTRYQHANDPAALIQASDIKPALRILAELRTSPDRDPVAVVVRVL